MVEHLIPERLREVEHPLGLDEDELVACVACGLCLPHCPTYRVTGFEIASPRGRIAAMRAVELDGAPIDDEFRDAMEACVQCRGCEAACPSGVAFGHLMERTRQALHRAPVTVPTRTRVGAVGLRLRRAGEWLAYAVVLPRHRLLMALTWVAWLGQRLRLVPRRLGLPRLTRASLRTPLRADLEPDAFLFTGCVMDAWQRDVHRAALRVMRATGAAVGLPGEGGACCGALHLHAGRIKEARRLARRVMHSLPTRGAVVVDSAGCGAAMKEYGRLLDTDEAYAFSARVVDFSKWVVAQPPLPLRRREQPVVVQDPCHLRHVQHAHGAVHTVLARGYTCSDIDDDGLCCGAGGAYALWQPALAGQIRDRKVAAILAAAPPGSFHPGGRIRKPGLCDAPRRRRPRRASPG